MIETMLDVRWATMWAELMDELCEIHLGLKPKRRTGPSVGERLQAAYEK